MAVNISWTKRADNNFDEIIEYLEINWGDQVTKKFITEVYDFLELIAEFPEIGSIENKENNIRGFHFDKTEQYFLSNKQ